MSGIKIAVPTSSASSKASKDFLKVSIAASTYNVPVEWTKSTDSRVKLENPKAKLTLSDSNAIVLYLHEHATKKPATTEELSLIELARSVSSSSEAIPVLNVLESALQKTKLEALSPASIVLFASLHDLLPVIKGTFPVLQDFLVTFQTTEAATKGFELAKVHTEEEKPTPIPTTSAADIGARKLREGIFKNNLEDKKILPVPGQRNILITSALPYVNNVPHLGNIIGSVLSADVFARYCKVRNINSLYICGTDEYGTAIETRALEEGVSPQEICDKYYKIHSDIYKWFDIGFDFFGRSATPKQTEITQAIFLELYKNGFIEQKTELQLFCPKHERFLADRFVEGICPRCGYQDARGDQCDKCGNLLDPMELIEPRCKIDGATPVPRDTTHFYVRLDALQPQVEKFVEEHSPLWSQNAQSITYSWLKQGLNARSITRDLKWGVPVPLKGYEDKVFYVWFDAPIGYISITANYTDAGVEGGQDWKKWWLPDSKTDVKLYQFMGKDNVPFHTVLFPACLLGTGQPWTKLHNISTTEYLQYEGDKFSKSRGIGVFGDQASLTGQSASTFRYYLLSSRPESSDSQFLWREFISKHNTELLNNLGNLVNRVIKFLNSKYQGILPDYTQDTHDTAQIHKFEEDVNQLLSAYIENMDAIRIKHGLRLAMDLSTRINTFLQDNKLDNNLFNHFPQRCAATLGAALNAVYLLSAVLSPFLPSTSDAIDEQINAPRLAIPDEWFVGDILPGHKIGKAQYLFKKIDEGEEEIWKSKFGGSPN